MAINKALKNQLSWEKLVAKTNPATVGAILFDTRKVYLKRRRVWFAICAMLNDEVRAVLDKHGVTGTYRMIYYDFSKSLWKYLSKYPEKLWDKYVDSVTDFYVKTHDIDKDVALEIVDRVIKKAKEIFSGKEVVDVGGEEVGSDTASEALGQNRTV